MPVFMVERQFAEQLAVPVETAREINAINDDEGVHWLSSFLSADKRKTFCLYEADDIEAIRAAAVRAGLPADTVVELSGSIAADGSFTPM
jgi:hypothetical protein